MRREGRMTHTSELRVGMLETAEEWLRLKLKQAMNANEVLRAENGELRERLGMQDRETESDQLEESCWRRGA
jgi:regulator of replication initiation timing